MARVAIAGDSQAGWPGAAAEAKLTALGHTVTRVHNDGKSPVAYVRTPALMSQYTSLAANADIVVLIFGHNSPAGAATRDALIQMKNAVHPPVLMSGPPLYPHADDQAIGTALRDQNQRIFGARYIDAWPSTPVTLARDAPGWHLTPASAVGWGHAIADAVQAALAPGGTASGGGGGIGTGAKILGLFSALALGAWMLGRSHG